jgi:hypothetical protein
LPEGLVGLLASPSHGLAIFSPVALVALLGLGRALDPATFALRTCYALAFAALVVVHAASGAYAPGYPNIATWHGGWTWGPRYLIEGMPLLAVLSWYGWPRMTRSRLGRPLAAVAAAAAIAINGAGFYLGWTSWFGTPDVDFCPGRLWSWRDNPTAALVWGLDPANECRPLHVGESRLDGTRTVFTFHEPAEWELLRRGWFKRNWPWEAHANGAEAEIEIPSSARGRLRAVVLELRPAYVPAAGQWVRVSVSGERGPRVRLSPSGTRIEVPIESGAGSHDGRDGRPWSVVLEFSAWTPRTWREILREHRLGSEWDVRQDAAILDRLELVQDPP